MQQDAVTRPPLRKRQRVEEAHEHASPHVLRALYELPAPIYDTVPVQGVQYVFLQRTLVHPHLIPD
jgi:hypothetical protein